MKPLMKVTMACGLLFGMFSVQNAWGYTYECRPKTGTPKQIGASFGTYTITDPTQNKAGKEFDGAATWKVGSSVKIICDEPANKRYRYFSSTSPLPQTTNDGHQWFHINEYLDTTVAVSIQGKDRYVPFTNVRGGWNSHWWWFRASGFTLPEAGNGHHQLR